MYRSRPVQALRLLNIEKRFGEIAAVRNANVTFDTGEIHAVVGENGAGKSTLLKIAAGILTPDAGEVQIEGKPLRPHTAAAAIRRGVGMVQQHFALVGVFTALENIVLGAEPTGVFGQLDLAKGRIRAAKVALELGLTFSLDADVSTLGVGDRQRLEIARVLYRNARVLIFDEPTAVLTAHEAKALYAILRRLASSGRAVVVVTHKLDEVVEHADTITVMRRGVHVETRSLGRGELARQGEYRRLAGSIMGEDPPAPAERLHTVLGSPALVVKKVTFGRALRGVSFEVRAGEVVGLAGIEGNGQRELVRLIAGLDRPDDGLIWVQTKGGKDKASDRAAVVHEDRHAEGLVLAASVRDNLVLGELARFSVFGFLRGGKIEREAESRRDKVRVEPRDLDRAVVTLSGGNQQKIVVARAIGRVEGGASALVLAHPTRGVDLGASRTIHQLISDAAVRKRIAVLVISSDLQELRTLCDRLLVIADGCIVAELASTASDAEIGERMLGRGVDAPEAEHPIEVAVG